MVNLSERLLARPPGSEEQRSLPFAIWMEKILIESHQEAVAPEVTEQNRRDWERRARREH